MPEETKLCTTCNKEKLLSNFWKKKNKLQFSCKDCQKQYHKDHYKNNKKDYIYRAKNRNKSHLEEMRKYIINIKNVPCMDCKVSYPSYVMDFDHREGEIKIKEISRLLNCSKQLIDKEISKCDIVCSNCHRIRTHKRLNNNL